MSINSKYCIGVPLRDIKKSIECYAILFAVNLTRVFPKKILYRVAKTAVKRSYDAKPSRIAKIRDRISSAFPMARNGEIDAMVSDFIEHLASLLVELVLIFTDRFDFDSMVVNAEDVRRRMDEARKMEKGIIVLSAHYGNWEAMAHWMAINGYRSSVVVRPHKNGCLDKKVFIPFRERHGNRSIERKGAIVAMARELRRKGVVGLMIDQMIPPPNDVETTLFGRPFHAMKSASQLHEKYESPVLLVLCERVDREKFFMHLSGPLEYNFDENEDLDSKIAHGTQYYLDELTEVIKRNPPQWLWSYDRWRVPKTKKESEDTSV